jgi:hypothetical protein
MSPARSPCGWRKTCIALNPVAAYRLGTARLEMGALSVGGPEPRRVTPQGRSCAFGRVYRAVGRSWECGSP